LPTALETRTLVTTTTAISTATRTATGTHIARSIAPPAARRCTQPAATYRRRRTGAALLVAAVVGGGALVADSVLSGSGGVPASAAGTGAAHVERAVRAAPGDSLWSIAEEHRGDIAITRYVEKLIDLNGGTRIEAGQLVRLP
jgi:hypothetical protein